MTSKKKIVVCRANIKDMDKETEELMQILREGEIRADDIMNEILAISIDIKKAACRKMTVFQLKQYMRNNEIAIPKKGTGKKGNLVRVDYIEAIEQSFD